MSPLKSNANLELINPRPEHFSAIQDLCRKVYPFSKPWSIAQLESHQSYFPDGQLIVIDKISNKVVGMAFSLIIPWDDYSPRDNWEDFTSAGFFTNHNPRKGRTLYGAEVMVDPEMRGQGIGKMLYRGRQKIIEKYGLKRIRAGARLRGYSKFKDKLSPQEYVVEVINNKIYDPTLSFQLNQGFVVIDVAANYLFNDPESLGYAAVIEWLNPKSATINDNKKQRARREAIISKDNYVPQFLPKELRRLVRKSTLVLGRIIKETEGVKFYKRIEYYRENLKKVRNVKNKSKLKDFMRELKLESKADRIKIAHAFSLQLELVNACETTYRTWRLRQKPVQQGLKTKVDLNFVLTAHPTEARPKPVVQILNQLCKLMLEGINSNYMDSDPQLISQIRLLWLHPLSKTKEPSVIDEAEYIYSLVFSKEIFSFLVGDKFSYDLKLRTWVGGDKDGHPWVNEKVMRECLTASRKHILGFMSDKLKSILSDLSLLGEFNPRYRFKMEKIGHLLNKLSELYVIEDNDGNSIKKWNFNYQQLLKNAGPYLKQHHEILLINKIFELFPALVLPIELREDSGEIANALKQKSAPIKRMLAELKNIAGTLPVTSYARALVISHCENSNDLNNALQLSFNIFKHKNLPIVPLFESREALVNSSRILKTWLLNKHNQELVHRFWSSRFEIMLGYSDSAKEIGVMPSRYRIRAAMFDLESVLKSFKLKPIFFHGSGGSVARGGGSLKEQIAWWPNSAIQNPKLTIQGEMIQRNFASKEILNSQCNHLTNESFRKRINKAKLDKCHELDVFVQHIETCYRSLIQNQPLLEELLGSTPYKYLSLLKIGSRPSKRPSTHVTIKDLRAIPWILCWTQTRILFPTWWGVGAAWKKMSTREKDNLKAHFKISPFFSSFVKSLGFTLAKVELDIWELYFSGHENQLLFEQFRNEFKNAVKFVHEISQEKQLIWYRPWLQESIQLRSPHIHILNLLQILAMQDRDEALLKETVVGIASGMLTTG